MSLGCEARAEHRESRRGGGFQHARQQVAGPGQFRGGAAYLVLAAVSLLVSLYLNGHLLGGLGDRVVAGNPGDVRLFTWYLQHGPWAVLHGHDRCTSRR